MPLVITQVFFKKNRPQSPSDMRKIILKIIGGLALAAALVVSLIALWLFYSVRQEVQKGAPFILDRAVVWAKEEWKGEKYTLAHLTTGFQDKVEEVVLFKGDIEYDQWNNPVYSNVLFRGVIDQKWEKNGEGSATRLPKKGRLELNKGIIRVAFDNGEIQVFELAPDVIVR